MRKYGSMSGKKVIVAMSGGVDSSVTLALLALEGYNPVGVTMNLVPRTACCGGAKDALEARRVCELFGVPHHTVDLIDLFDAKVVTPAKKIVSATTLTAAGMNRAAATDSSSVTVSNPKYVPSQAAPPNTTAPNAVTVPCNASTVMRRTG